MKFKSLFIGLTALAVMMSGPLSASSYKAGKLPDIEENKELTLTVSFSYSKNNVSIPISGAEISINRISDLTVENGYARYTVVEFNDYQELVRTDEQGNDITFAGLSGTESNELAEKFSLKVPQAEQKETTASNGMAVFENLTAGMYLVRETNASGRAEEYELFDAFLISVPLSMSFTGDNVWEYNVIAEPKTTVNPNPDEHSNPESSEPEHSNPEGSEPEHSNPESSEPEHSNPESSEPEHSNPESSEPEHSNPEGSEPEHSNPESSEPENSNPESSEPEHSNPEGSEPEHSNPESSEPENSNPEGSGPEISTPDNSTPSEPTSDPQESSKPGVPTLTGEVSMLFIVILVFFVSALVIAVSLNKKKRTDKNK